MNQKEQERFHRAMKNIRLRSFQPAGAKPPSENMAEILRNAILESDGGATVAETIAAMERVKAELMSIALDTTYAYRMFQDYSVDIHGQVHEKE